MSTIPPLPENTAIVVDDQGVYRWPYEFGLFKNPTILFTIWKIFVGIAVVFFVFALIFDVANGSFTASDLLETLKFDGGILALMLVLSVIGYAIYGWMQGGKYCVVFTMDEEGITHKQLPKQYDKAKVVSALNVVAGIATGKPGQVGIGLLSARDSLTSSFEAVRSIQGMRNRGVIKVNEPAAKNQIYVEPQDYDFVYEYIVTHCPNATAK